MNKPRRTEFKSDSEREEARRLFSTPTHLLSDEECERKSELLAEIDPLNSDWGQPHKTERWLLGAIEGDLFMPAQKEDFDPIPIPPGVPRPAGVYLMAKVPTYRDGQPCGPVIEFRL